MVTHATKKWLCSSISYLLIFEEQKYPSLLQGSKASTNS